MKDAPGLKVRRRADGSLAAYWVASQCSRRAADYRPKTVSLAHLPAEKWAEACVQLSGQLKAWLDRRSPVLVIPAEPTVSALLDHYVGHDLSPYRQVKYNTQKSYDEAIMRLRKAVGDRLLKKLAGVDFLRWHEQYKQKHGVQSAHNIMSMLRRVLRWGIVLEIPHAKRLTDIIGEMEFEQAPPRTELLTYDHAVAIIAKAHEEGRPSIAFAQALQFELMLRQKDVIGEWLPDMSKGGIRHTAVNVNAPKRWENGLTWSHIGPDMVMRKLVTKTARKSAAIAEFNISLYPLVMAEIERVPMERRVGAMILNEETGIPYTANTFRTVWRTIADAAGVPKEVQNRDSRAGGITEATDGGAGLELVRHHSTHKNPSMTARYSRGTLKKTAEVARLRVANRQEKKP